MNTGVMGADAPCTMKGVHAEPQPQWHRSPCTGTTLSLVPSRFSNPSRGADTDAYMAPKAEHKGTDTSH